MPAQPIEPLTNEERQLDTVAHAGAVIVHASQSKHQRIAILDAGAQYGKVIDRKVRELCVESDILPMDTSIEMLNEYGAIIISGGPQSVYGPEAPKFDSRLFTLEKPIFGICYGMQLINHAFGGKVEKTSVREDGQFEIKIVDSECALFSGLPDVVDVLLTHGDTVVSVGDELKRVAETAEGLITAIQHKTRPIYGVQFHPEVDLTVHGKEMFVNFIEKIAHLDRSFTIPDRSEAIQAEIRQQVGDKKVLMLLSGGVDSSVCAALIKHALGENATKQIVAIHIDNGFMRLNESDNVAIALERIGLPITVLHAQQQFYSATTVIKGEQTQALNVTLNPEHKRKIIGDTFMHVSNDYIAKLNLDPTQTLLAQGTLRPDLIESASHMASSNADVIKTHHNDTELVRALRSQGRVIEPLRDYHKDEVRELGELLGLPHDLVWRQPFPGPGLAIRIIAADQPFHTDNDERIIKLLESYQTPSINATLLPCRTVGVQGDQRSYSSLVALSTDDAQPDWKQLFIKAKDIPKRVQGVNRVVFVYGSKLVQGALTEITPTHLTPDVIAQLQHADEIVNKLLLKYDLIKPLSQVPVILFPVNFGVPGARGICIRTFVTKDFMTGVPACPGSKELPTECVEAMVKQILEQVPGIARVCLDLTSKPPATTEWE